MGYAKGGPVWHIIKIQHDITRDCLLRSIVMNAMGLSILAFGTRASNQEKIPADPNVIARDRIDPRAGILSLAKYPTLNQRQLGIVRAKEVLLGDGLMFEFVPPEWAENPFGEENHDPFNLGDSSSDSDSFIQEVAPPLPWIGEDVLEEVLGEEAPDCVGEGGGEDPPQFVPFDKIADYDYVNLAAEEEEDQAAPANGDGFDERFEGEDVPRRREKRGLKSPIFRPRPKPRPRPRPGQWPRKGTGIGRPIILPTKQNVAQVLKTQGVDKIKVVDKIPA